MGFSRKKKGRGPYDKIVKYAQELFRQELTPLRTDLQTIRAQNDKTLEYVRQIWNNNGHREGGESEEQ